MTIGRSTLTLFPNPFIEPTFPNHKSLSSERLSSGHIVKPPAIADAGPAAMLSLDEKKSKCTNKEWLHMHSELGC